MGQVYPRKLIAHQSKAQKKNSHFTTLNPQTQKPVFQKIWGRGIKTTCFCRAWISTESELEIDGVKVCDDSSTGYPEKSCMVLEVGSSLCWVENKGKEKRKKRKKRGREGETENCQDIFFLVFVGISLMIGNLIRLCYTWGVFYWKESSSVGEVADANPTLVAFVV